LLAGRSWRVTWIDWTRQRCFVEEAEHGGRARWHTPGVRGAGFALTRAARDVLLGTDPPVALTDRARRKLAEVRDRQLATVHPGGSVVVRSDDIRWWTWAGYRANATLSATLSDLADTTQRVDDASLRLHADLTPDMWRAGTGDAGASRC